MYLFISKHINTYKKHSKSFEWFFFSSAIMIILYSSSLSNRKNFDDLPLLKTEELPVETMYMNSDKFKLCMNENEDSMLLTDDKTKKTILDTKDIATIHSIVRGMSINKKFEFMDYHSLYTRVFEHKYRYINIDHTSLDNNIRFLPPVIFYNSNNNILDIHNKENYKDFLKHYSSCYAISRFDNSEVLDIEFISFRTIEGKNTVLNYRIDNSFLDREMRVKIIESIELSSKEGRDIRHTMYIIFNVIVFL